MAATASGYYLSIAPGSRWLHPHAGVVTVTRVYRRRGIVWVAFTDEDGHEWGGIPYDTASATWNFATQ